MNLFGEHYGICSTCKAAKAKTELCEMGRSFFENKDEPVRTDVQALSVMADKIAERLMVRTDSGAQVMVPMQKSSRGVAVQISGDVMLRIPERDIQVYDEMKTNIMMLLKLANSMGRLMTVDEATRKIINDCRQLSMQLQGEIERRMGT